MNQQWDRLVSLTSELDQLRVNLLSKDTNGVELIRRALEVPHERGAAFELINFLTTEEREALLPDLTELACFANKYQRDAFLVICSLPRQWTAQHMNSLVERILQRASEEEFGLVLSLLSEVNPNYGLEIARRGLDNKDESIRQIAKVFLADSK